MIFNIFKKHTGYYIGLFSILVSSLFLINSFSYDRKFQMLAIVAAAFFYALWGIFHHLIHHDFSSKIMIEYILMSALGTSFVLFVMRGI